MFSTDSEKLIQYLKLVEQLFCHLSRRVQGIEDARKSVPEKPLTLGPISLAISESILMIGGVSES